MTTTTPTQLTPCPEVFSDGNIFAILGKARRCLKRAGRRAEAAELTEAVTSSGSYDVAIGTVMRYVDDAEEQEES